MNKTLAEMPTKLGLIGSYSVFNQFMDLIQISSHSDMSAEKSEQKNDTNATMTATFSCCD